jgi:hypothetical protein
MGRVRYSMGMVEMGHEGGPVLAYFDIPAGTATLRHPGRHPVSFALGLYAPNR